MNTNFFFSNFSGNSGISRQNPGISRPKSLISLVSRDVSNFLAPTRSRGRPPPHPKISGPKSLGLGSFFLPEKFQSIFHRKNCNSTKNIRTSLCRRATLRFSLFFLLVRISLPFSVLFPSFPWILGVLVGITEILVFWEVFLAFYYFASSPETFCEYFFHICLGIWHRKMVGIFGEFFVVSGLRFLGNRERKILEKFGKFGRKSGTKIRKIRGAFVLQLF